MTNSGTANREDSISALPVGADASAPAHLLHRFALLAVLLVAAALRLWRLAQNEWGNEYYAAGVRSMTLSLHNFLYNSFDPAGFVSVDKPPVALWIQAAGAKFFGFSPLSLFIPQVLEGLASIWIVWHLVQRHFGARAGLSAALFLAVTPISVAIDRSNNTDSCLVLVLLLAAWALMRAAEEGSRRYLILSLALVGLGFNVKMSAAFVVLPTFVLVYYLGAPLDRRRRLEDLGIAATVLAVASVAWVLVYDLTPPEHRPFVGTTKRNSMLELAVGPYAVGRFVSPLKRSVSIRREQTAQPAVVEGGQTPAKAETPSQPTPLSRLKRLFVRAPAGPLRLADGQLAGQVAWLLPLAVMGLVLCGLRRRFYRPVGPEHLTLLLFFGWTVTYGVVYSFAGGIMHLYYLATMAPPLAALAGVGLVNLWERYGRGGWNSALLPVALIVTTAWQLYIEASALEWNLFPRDPAYALFAPKGAADWIAWLHVALVAGTAVAVIGLFLLRRSQSRRGTTGALAACMVGIGLSALLVVPTAWTLSSVLVPGHGILPSADPARLAPDTGIIPVRFPGGFAKVMDGSKLIRFLQANRGEEAYLLATSGTRLAAPIIICAGESVMAMGGFHGLDPILSPEKLAKLVGERRIRFVMLGDLSVVSRRLGADEALRPITEWVHANGRPVEPALWRSHGSNRDRPKIYDLRPQEGLVPVSDP